MKNIVLVSTLLLGVSSAYDFSDEFFNQLLSQEYDDFASGESVFLHPRARRDEEASKCHHRHKFCCGDELMSKLHEKYRDTKRECFKQVTGKEFGGGPPFTCEELEERKKEMTCVAECAGKKKGAVDDNGNIKEDEVKKLVAECTEELEWFKPMLDEVTTKCIGEAKAAAEKYDKKGCNPSDIKFSFCIFKEIQLNCPADQIKDQGRCDAMRESLKKHDHPPVH
ncbi:hypothetical protein QE152_g12671 [Popillia japonica]|uniref:Uncharacterized protein n=1 Tax=Popillia japonica TaxID=7064 RepID=A0AAW1LQC8_POPJA